MIEMLCGAVGALLVIAVFIAGYKVGLGHRSTSPAVEMTEEEKRERKRLIAEQDAFRSLMGYSTDTAYGAAVKGDNE